LYQCTYGNPPPPLSLHKPYVNDGGGGLLAPADFFGGGRTGQKPLGYTMTTWIHYEWHL